MKDQSNFAEKIFEIKVKDEHSVFSFAKTTTEKQNPLNETVPQPEGWKIWIAQFRHLAKLNQNFLFSLSTE